MSSSLFIKGAVVLAVLGLILLLPAPAAQAADQPTGPGSPSQQEMKTDSSEAPPSIHRDIPSTTELKKEFERPMKAPESGEFARFESQNLKGPDLSDFQIAVEQDRASSTSF